MTIHVSNLSHAFLIRRNERLPALHRVSLEVPRGSFTALLGPSGCGKSTLLRILAGLLLPDSGHALIFSRPPAVAVEQKDIAWLAQNPALLPWLTVRDNIALARRIHPIPRPNLLSPDELLSLVGLSDFAAAYPLTLSGGMQHRVALARTLALGASVWLMDEPFASLDDLTRETLGADLLSLWQQFQPTILWITHNIHEAVRLAGRILVMSPRPGHIHTDLNISLPYPRREDDPAYLALVASLKAALRSPFSSPVVSPA